VCGGGFDNPVEIDFTDEGEMLGTVNILHGNPRQDCLVHWVEGGVYPRADQEQCLAEFKRTGDLLPPIKEFGHVAVAGMTRYRSDGFGPEYRNSLFISFFNRHKVIRSILERSGSTFTSSEEEFLSSEDTDFHPTDVLEDADGSLLVINTGGWFRIGCPVSEIAKPDVLGVIYRIRKKGMKKIDDPRGLALNLEKRSTKALVTNFLDDPRPAVRDRVIDLLASDERTSAATDKLHELFTRGRGHASRTQRRNAVWMLCQIRARAATRGDFLGLRSGSALLEKALQDPSESVRLTAANAAARCGTAASRASLRRMAVEDKPSIRSAAATAIWKPFVDRAARSDSKSAKRREELSKLREELENIRDEVARMRKEMEIQLKESTIELADAVESLKEIDFEHPRHDQGTVPALFESIRASSLDRLLEHALIYALIRIDDRIGTVPFLKDPNPQVRRAALIALDQMDDGKLTCEEVTPLLDTDDPQLRKTALAVISARKGWATELVGLLRGWLEETKPADEHLSLLRGTLLAQAADPAIQHMIAETLVSDKTSTPVRLLLWEVIYRAPLGDLPEAWLTAVQRTLQGGSPSEIRQVIAIVNERKLEKFDEWIMVMARNKEAETDLRIESLAAVAPRLRMLDDQDFALLVGQLKVETPPLLLLAAARGLSEAPLGNRKLHELSRALPDTGPLALPILLRAYQQTDDETTGLGLVAALNQSPAVENLSADELAGILRKFPESVQKGAAGLFKRLGGSSLEEQKAKLTGLTKLLDPPGDAKRGREVFFSRKAGCANCHTIANEGGRVGPDLTKIAASRSGTDLLEAIVFPSASFAREFRPYIVATDSGKVHTGIISRQTADAIHLRTADLAEIRIPRAAIEEIKESNTSIMPKGIDAALSPEELRDLLAYLRNLK
jgi:putative heme-binding domain-containing protein